MVDRPEYTEIEHTADVGIALRAPDLASAFERAAAASFDMMCDLDLVAPDRSFDLRIEGRSGDLEHLMVRWLSELLYLYSSERVLFSEFEVLELREAREDGVRGADAAGAESSSLLVARVCGESLDTQRHHMKVDLKAPTYHQLAVERDRDQWSVRVIFDI